MGFSVRGTFLPILPTRMLMANANKKDDVDHTHETHASFEELENKIARENMEII